MTVLLIPLALCSLSAAFAAAAHRQGEIAPWRSSILRAAVVGGVWTAAVTEVASLFSALDAEVVAGAWALLAAAALAAAVRERRTLLAPRLEGRGGLALAMLVGTAAIAVATLAVAWCAPPNTWDSMTYHMSRVAHWIQNGSVALYPTHIPRQVLYSPWAETAILHLQLLSGGDRLANLVQWGSILGCLIGTSAVAALLRPAPNTASAATVGGFAALYAATCPMAILQASSTQNDAVAAFWMVCFVFFVLEFRRRAASPDAIFAALSLGLGLLTKITVYVFALPWLAWFAWVAIRRRGWSFVAGAALVVLAVNAGHEARSLAMWVRADGGAEVPAPPAARGIASPPPSLVDRALLGYQRYLTASPSPFLVLSNLMRNVALELASPFASVNDGMTAAVEGVHRLVGLASSDARATYPRGTPFRLSASRHEDDTGNPLHFLLAAWATLACLGRRRGGGTDRIFAAALLVAFILFCAVFKWQPWHTRLLLPLLVLAAPLVAARLEGARWRGTVPAAAGLLWAASLPWLTFGEPRALLGPRSVLTVGRSEQYFSNRPDLQAPYTHAAESVRAAGCDAVGLISGGNDWEYPLWPLLGAEAGRSGVRIEHVLVDNAFARTQPDDGFAPCAIALIGQPARESVELRGVAFALGFREEPLQVFYR